jgi:outer membrane receptor protein involved in Fe transport
LHRGEDYGLKFLFAEGFRNPSTFEAFFDDNKTYTSNPSLRPETIRSYEVVLWGRPRAGVSLRASAFRWETKDLIEQASVDDGMGNTLLKSQNTFSLNSTGGELEGTYRDSAGWLGFASATLAEVERVEADGTKSTATNAPELTGTAGVSTPLIAKRFHLSTEARVIGPRHTRTDGLDTKTFLGWDAAIYVPGWHGFDLTLGCKNLLGTREEKPAQNDFDRVDANGNPVTVAILPGPGREIYARLGYVY